MNVSLVCIALLALLCFALGFNVSMARARSETMFEGEVNPEDPLYKARRAHGNTIEYAPILALLIFILGLQAQSSWVTWCMVGAVFFMVSSLFGSGPCVMVSKPVTSMSV